ncbi:MAG: hypothetical protein P4L53_09605 [Candidatus Obscuribacterales bacterium]|nr:hypothetical protein [Candidatus Obscuribacterales bacterium]
MNESEDEDDDESEEAECGEYEEPILNDVIISLRFSCSKYDRETITEQLGITPDNDERAGWSYSLPTREDSFLMGTYGEWHQLLAERWQSFENLRMQQFRPELHIWVVVPEDVDKYFVGRELHQVSVAPKFSELLSRLGIALKVEHNKAFKVAPVVKYREKFVLEIDGSGPHYHADDETMFFFWLNNIPAVKSITGVDRGLYLGLDEPIMDDASLRSLIALLARYKFDMSCLRKQICDSNIHWLNQPGAYWYNDLFGAQKKSKRHRPEYALARFVSNAEKFEKAKNPILTLHNYESAMDIIRKEANLFDQPYVESVVSKYILSLKKNSLFEKASEVEEQMKLKTLYSSKST